MFREENNLKDETVNLKVSVRDNFFPISYPKTNKLISALYMVTDIMDKEEPLRSKLRNLGANVISDIYSNFDKGQAFYNQVNNRVSEILSFIEIGSSVGIISEMNSNILIKEFVDLSKSLIESIPKKEENWLEEFIKEDKNLGNSILKERIVSMGQISMPSRRTDLSMSGTRIGIQKGGTLLKALSDRIPDLSNLPAGRQGQKNVLKNNIIKTEQIDVLKNKRREEIILVIKDKMKNSLNFDGVSIKDIVLALRSLGEDRGEKTLQRELVSMVSSGVLKKTGEKRWSRYSLN